MDKIDASRYVVIKADDSERLVRSYSVLVSNKMKADLEKLKFYNIDLADSTRKFLQGLIDLHVPKKDNI